MRIPTDHRLTRGDQPSPLAFLARIARRSPDGALALYAGSGLLGAGFLLTRGAHWWVLLPTFVALALFGLWGIVDRSADEAAARTPSGSRQAGILLLALSFLRVMLAVAGVAAALLAILLPLSASLDNVVH